MKIMNIKANRPLQGLSKHIVVERPNRRSGIESLTNVCGHMRFSGYLFGSDVQAMRTDWQVVGNDIRKVMCRHGK